MTENLGEEKCVFYIPSSEEPLDEQGRPLNPCGGALVEYIDVDDLPPEMRPYAKSSWNYCCAAHKFRLGNNEDEWEKREKGEDQEDLDECEELEKVGVLLQPPRPVIDRLLGVRIGAGGRFGSNGHKESSSNGHRNGSRPNGNGKHNKHNGRRK